MTIFLQIWLALNSLIFIAIGLMPFVAFNTLINYLGFKLTKPISYVDIAATYGGEQLFIGCVLAFCIQSKWLPSGLLFCGFLYAFLAAGRILGMIAFQTSDKACWQLLWIEIICAGVSFALYWFAYGRELV